MKREFLGLLCCPECRADLQLLDSTGAGDEIEAGRLVCTGCTAAFEITDGVPRFVIGDEYAKAFTVEWTVFSTAHLDSQTGLDVSKRDFQDSFNFPLEELNGKLVLDAGCGMGRFAEIARDHGAKVVCVDLSFAIDAAYQNLNHRGDMAFLQADLFKLPLKHGVFDVIYSLGVLHHTPNPPGAFASIVPHLKPGGVISARLYARYNKAYIATTEFYRKLTRRLPKRVLLYLCYIAVPLYYVNKIPAIGPFITRILLPVSVNWPTHKWRVCNTFDLYSPEYTFHYDHYTVFQWFKKAQLRNIEVIDPEGGVCFIASR